MIIRDETPADIDAIRSLTEAAFAPKAFSDGDEHLVNDRLRDRGELVVSLVAESAGRVVGHVAFSRVSIKGAAGDWFGLGPVAVTPDLQKQGIGSAMITDGLQRIKDMGAEGCALVGDPKYYSRFGFVNDEALIYPDAPPTAVQWLGFGKAKATGELVFSPAFDGP